MNEERLRLTPNEAYLLMMMMDERQVHAEAAGVSREHSSSVFRLALWEKLQREYHRLLVESRADVEKVS